MAIAALVGSTLAGVTGFGGAAILLPVLVHFYGVRDAIPILTVAQLIGNSSRTYFHFAHLEKRVVAYYAIGAIPMALLGGLVFAYSPSTLILRFLGVFLVATVLWRRLGGKKTYRMPVQGFIGVGAVFGFLSALVGGVGPFLAPFFLNYGLVKGAYISTEAASTVVMHIFKLLAYRQTSNLPLPTVLVGMALGPLMITGSFLGKKILHVMPERIFLYLIEVTLFLAGLNFLFKS
jgi:uncharacterized membrane protein YfcA